ncbi:38.7 kDa protein [Plodia interpunctella granulovirus]|uniref:38.7 kDa protein n=1 Tax=Plodia interpunctella granulovirus TaxID=262175 RepID=A0A1L5JGM3_9BBAC|nr:38.7 kDa protein [Plodia interpunctella granulovirus]APO13944.1 38.7 kDa protein [Plodia interpunctella granulovirus]
MYYYINKIFDYIWPDVEDRMRSMESRLDLLEEFEHRMIVLEHRLNALLNKLEEEKNSDDGYASDDSDGSNLAVFVKPCVHNHTQIQYVTGDPTRFNLRKQLYDDGNMEKVVDGKELSPRRRIAAYNKRFSTEGYRLTSISDNSVIVEGPCEHVKEIIQSI